MKHIIHIRLLLLMLLFACICHTPTMAYTPPTSSAATMAGTDDENTEDDTGGTDDNTGGDSGTTLPTDREPADVVKYDWWIDNDFDRKTTVPLTSSWSEFSCDVSALKAGIHTLYVMTEDAYGRKGQINSFLFFIPVTTVELQEGKSLTYCEYWFDDDYANHKTAPISGTTISITQESIAALAPGTHYLRYRVMNDQGVFSSVINHQFLVQGAYDVIADVDYCEAWIDNDYDQRKPVTLNGSWGDVDFDIDALRPGLHTVYTHARNTNKRWGQVNSFVFFKPQPEETLPNAQKITRWEYWFDDNFDQRKSANVSGTVLTLPDADKSLADFTVGVHYFYYRALNNEGVWSPARRHLFYYSGKDESGSSPLTGYRYVFNGQSYKGTIKNESTYTFNKTITIPAVQTMPIEKDSCQFTFTTVNDKDTVRMQRNVGYLFAIQFKNKVGAWSNPIDTTFVMSQKDSVEVKPLAMESTVTFDRPEAGLYCPFKMTFSKRGTFFLTPSEKCHILLFDAEGNEQEEITPDDFSDGLSIGKYFETGTYYGIIYNLVDDNASSTLSLKLGQADKVTPTPSIAFDNDSKTVTITNKLDPDVDTYYTLDGNDPTASTSETCMHYDTPFTVDRNCTVKAISKAAGYDASIIAKYEVKTFKVATPRYTKNGLNVILYCDTPEARIYYTTDGSDPSGYGSTECVSGTSIAVSTNITLKAIAKKEGYYDSDLLTAAIDVANDRLSAPTAVRDGNTLKLYCDDGADIYYTKTKGSTGTTPTTSSTKYDAANPITLTENCVVMAIACQQGKLTSSVMEEKITDFKVATPTLRVDVATASIILECEEKDAKIYYKKNPNEGDDPADDGTLYEEPLLFGADIDIVFCAKKAYFNDSDPVREQVKRADYTCGQPNIEQATKTETDEEYFVTITTTTEGATIWYTTDGTDPATSQTRTQYSSMFKVDDNCTIWALARKADKFDNDAKLEITNFKVAQPVFAGVTVENGTKGYAKFTCGTQGATIKYDWDGMTKTYDPDKGIKFDEDMIGLEVYAVKGKHTPSDKLKQDVIKSEYTCKQPKIVKSEQVSSSKVSIEMAAEEGATIWYTDNGNDPLTDIANCKQYEGVFVIDHNCQLNAYAAKADKFNSALAKPLTIDNLQVEAIQFTIDKDAKTLAITAEGATAIYYEIGNAEVTENSPRYDGTPITLTDNRTVYVMATGKDLIPRENSLAVDWFVCEEVTSTYNGRYLTLGCNTADAKITYSIDDGEEQEYTHGDPIDVQGLTVVKAKATKPNWNESNMPDFTVPCYYAGEAVYVKEKGNLEKAFEWCGGLSTDKTELTVIGNVNHDDLDSVKAKNWLQFLDMKEAQVVEKSLPDEAFAGMSQLLCITLPDNITSVGSRLLKGDSRLGAVIWNSTAAVPADLFDGVVHANALIYVSSPAIAANAPLRNRVVNGMADEIVLSDASSAEGNFYCPIEFTAKSITYEHAYGMETETGIGKCRGWEAISLPFDVQKMIHYDEKRASLKDREILPFAADGNDDTPRFWLYSLNGEFTSASGIEANTPYIICMPNCKDYGDIYNLNGKVTFRSENVDVHPSQEIHEGVQKTYRFVPNTQYVAQCDTVMALNIYQDYQGNPEGSVFVKNWRAANPFEAYITSDDAEAMNAQMFRIDRYATAIDGWTAFAQRDIYSENGNLYINCQRDCVVRLYTTQGQLVRVLQLHAGLNEITGIARGIYLVNSVKIVVK